MAVNQDARPFVDLKKDAEEFEAKFKEDIEECLTFLDAKITALICDPDSLEGKGKSVKHNAKLEFSKAKYEIFMSVKSLIITKEREWQSYISEMKKLFIENVEIFLAGTKLEVKLPPPEYHSCGSRKSPGNRKCVTGSVFPILNSITRNIPVLSSPLRKEGIGEDNSKVVREAQSNRGDRLSAKFNISPEYFLKVAGTSATISLTGKGESSDNSENESKAVVDKVQFNRRSRLSVKLKNPPRVAASHSQKDSTTDSSENEAGTVVENVQLGRRGRRPATSIKLSKSTIQACKETSDIEMDTEEVAQDKVISTRKPVRGRKSVRVVDETPELALSQTSSDEQSDQDVPSYVGRHAKPSARRKTLLPTSVDVPGSDIIPGLSNRTSSKRKTIGGVSSLQTAAPSKRLKVSSRKDLSLIQEDAAVNDNLLESDDNYSDWMTLKSLDGKIPTVPAIYEVKVWRAKKTAYIGSCDSLRQKLTLYKLRQNSGHKHLDKFIDRNFNDIQVRFEVVSSVEDAKNEVKGRVKRFVDQYKTTPAYN